MYQNGYLHGSLSIFLAKSAIYTAAGCQHKNAIYTAAFSEPFQLYTRLPCVHIKSLFTRQPFKSQIGYIHCCRVYTKSMAEDIYTAAGWESMYQNGYLHGSLSIFLAKSAIYTAAGCQHKNAIYTAAFSEPFQLYTRLPCVHIKSLFTRQPFKSQIGYIHCCRVYTKSRYLHGSRSKAKSAKNSAAGCIQKIVIYTAAVQEPNRLYGYTPLNIHEIWLRLLLGEHLLYIRAKMTSFFNSLD